MLFYPMRFRLVNVANRSGPPDRFRVAGRKSGTSHDGPCTRRLMPYAASLVHNIVGCSAQP